MRHTSWRKEILSLHRPYLNVIANMPIIQRPKHSLVLHIVLSTLATMRKYLSNFHSHFNLSPLFHSKAISTYDELIKRGEPDQQIYVYKACCLYAMGQNQEAKEEAEKCLEDSSLKMRILFHLAQKLGDEKEIMNIHSWLSNSVEDQLCMAALHYLRSHFEEATEIYKKLLIE